MIASLEALSARRAARDQLRFQNTQNTQAKIQRESDVLNAALDKSEENDTELQVHRVGGSMGPNITLLEAEVWY